MIQAIWTILGTTFGAVAVWLAVRIVNRRERWAKWTAVALAAVLVSYSLSFGPACWISSRTSVGASRLPVIYRPMMWVISRDRRFARALNQYAELGAEMDWHWFDFSNSSGRSSDYDWMHQ